MADLPETDKPRDARFEGRAADGWPERIRAAIIPAVAFAGYRAYRLGGEVISVILAIMIAALYLASGLAARQSTDLTVLRPNIERWFSQTFEGARADLGELSLRWNPSDDTVILTATDIVVYDLDDRIVQTLPLLRLTTTKSSLLDFKPELRDLEIAGGEVSWVIRNDGTVIAGIGRPDTVGVVGPTYEGTIDKADDSEMSWLSGFQSVSLQRSRAYIQDRRTGLDVAIEIDRLDGRKDDATTLLEIDGVVVSDDQRGGVQLALQLIDDMQTFDIALTTERFRPDSLATETGRLTALKGLALPIDARLTARYGREIGLEAAWMRLYAGAGTVSLAGADQQVSSLQFEGTLSPGDAEMQVRTLSIDSATLSLTGEGLIREIGRLYDGDIGTSPQFDLSLRDTRLDLTPVFPAPLQMDAVRAVGQIDVDARRLTFDQLLTDFGEFSLSMELDIATGSEGLSDLRLMGVAENGMNAQHLLSLWPIEAASGVRRWIDRSILDGTMENVAFAVALDEAFFVSPSLDAANVELTFDVRDGVARYISTMTPVVDAQGSGRIKGANFGFVIESGKIDNIEIVSGDVNIPRLERGGDIFITAQGRGPVADLLSLINQPPFRYMDIYGVSPDGFSGTADVTLSIQRPLLEFFDQNRIEYSVEGTFSDTSAPFKFGSFGLTGADVTVTGGKEGLFVNGDVNLGPWRANLNWEERYGQNGEPTRYRISGPLTRKAMDGFGFGFREAFGGVIDMDVEAIGRGIELEEAYIDFGLEQAEIAFGDVWSKSIGDPGRLRATIVRSDDVLTIQNARVEAPGLSVSGQASLQTDLVLQEAVLDTITIDGLIDGRLRLTRDMDNARLAVDAEGRTLNISQWVEAALTADGETKNDFPLALDAMFEEIVLSPGYVLNQAALTYRHDGMAIELMSLQGTRPDGPFEISLNEGADTAIERTAVLRIPDLSDASSRLVGLDSFTGGSLLIEARLPKAGEVGPTLGTARAADFTVRDAPFLAQILSLASLTGIFNTLSGSGLSFDELVLDFAMQGRNLSIRDAKLRGPAIGMTSEGDIALSDRQIDFSGTLVPTYTANSLLGDIPLLGDLLVGQDGEGVFAVTYAVRGPFSGAQISINPLSALAPGFIRGIFRESRDDLPDSVVPDSPTKEDIESVRPEEDVQPDDDQAGNE